MKDELLESVLREWTLERVQNMSLEEYNKQGDKTTFCYMLEYGTRPLGNISEASFSTKFEIFERKDKSKTPTSDDYGYDSNYTWRNRGGIKKTREEAFEYTKNIIVETIIAAQKGIFSSIDGKDLAPLVLWKIAFLYSNKRILSISDKKALRFIADYYGMRNVRNARVSSLHKFLMDEVVQQKDYWTWMGYFWKLYDAHRKGISELDVNEVDEKFFEKKVIIKDVTDSLYLRSLKMVLVTKQHNRLQEEIYDNLVEVNGEENVIKEKNNVDILVRKNDSIDFYEVKISSSAKYCIRMALGQIIEYAYNYKTQKSKKLIIVGNHPLTTEDEKYVDFIKGMMMDMSFSYVYKSV